jgi:2'-5' RNA ligase
MRLFVGIEFPAKIIDALAAVQGELRAHCERGRFKRRENFHLTLKFLGEVAAGDLSLLTGPLAKVAAGFDPFRLQLGRLGQFGGGGAIRVAWVDVAGDTEPLKSLQGQVEEVLATLGFQLENRPWRPHITLAQDVVLAAGAPSWAAYKIDRTAFSVAEFAVILSEEIDRRRVYTPIHRFPLKK